MTREEAIQHIAGLHYEEDFPYTDTIADFVKERNEAIDMAIEALKREDTMLKEIERILHDIRLRGLPEIRRRLRREGGRGMRLIDADTLKKAIEKEDNAPLYDRLSVYEVIDNAPTIDAVEVVRCNDCRHRIYDEYRCLYYCSMYYGQGDVSDDNFCQWGAKMDGERSE